MLRAGCRCAPPSLVCGCWGWKRIWGAELPFSATSPGSLDIAVTVCWAPQREGVRVCNTIRGSLLWGRQGKGVCAPVLPSLCSCSILPGVLGVVAGSRSWEPALGRWPCLFSKARGW